MRKYSHLSLGFLLILLSLPSIASAQYRNNRSDRRDRVCVYQDNNFRGAERCYNPGDSVPDARGMGISSMRVEGDARVIAFANRNFRGQSDEFTSDVANMARVGINGNRNWNDRVWSFEVVSDRSGTSGRYPDRDDRYPTNPPTTNYPGSNVQEGICVFDRPNFQGRSQCWNDGSVADLRDWSDRIASVRVTGGARVTVYRDINFVGDRMVIDRDVPDLAAYRLSSNTGTWSHQVSSFQLDTDRYRGRRRF
jgi:hypothetical protein